MRLKDSSLKNFLEYKTIYYDKIDYTYIEKAAKILTQKIKLPYIIHIIGTNGKGSTGRFLSHYLHKNGYKTLHYSSPHIKKFNERIWLNGSDISDEKLEEAHLFLQKIYDEELLKKLTYFEYTTLLAFYISRDCDYLVLEAGLGGEFDATSSVKNDLTLLTTIGLDHTAFLGNSIEEITRTKARSADRKIVVGYQEHKEVFEVLKEFEEVEILKVDDFNIDYEFNFASYLKRNLSLVLKALEELNIPINLEVFNTTPLFGRCQKIVSNITIDVGHNPLAAKVILNEFKDKKVTLIYNSYEDKDYKEVLKILKPIIEEVFILDLDDKRVVKKEILEKSIRELDIKLIEKIALEKTKEYLVFGSFLVVEKFLSLIDYEDKKNS